MRITIIPRGVAGIAAAVGVSAVLVGGGCANSSSAGSVVALTVRNSSTVASKVVGSIQALMVSANQADAGVSAAATDQPSSSFSVAAFAAAQLQALLDMNTQGLPAIAAGTVTTVACNKGDYTITPAQQGGAPSYLLTYEDCYDPVFRTTYQGSLTVRDIATSGDLSQPSVPGSLAATFDLNGLQVSSAGRGSLTTMQGSFDYSASSTDGKTVDQTLSGTRISLTRSGDLIILYSFQLALSEDRNTLAFSLTASGGLHSDALNGTLNFTTVSPLNGTNLATKPPTTGVLKVSGRLNSTLTIKPITGSTSIDIDSNGDGISDFTLHSQWLALT